MFMGLTAYAENVTPLADQAVEGVPAPAWMGMVGQFLPLVLLLVLFYFIILRPQRKKDKQTRDMLAALQVGDKIQTIGGMVGKITKIKDDEVLFETGSVGNPNEKSYVKIAKWAIKEVIPVEKA